MRLIPIKQLDNTIKKHFKNSTKPLKIATFKKDRYIIIKMIADTFTVEEYGYQNKNYSDLTPKELHKLVKKISKIEFPRSNNLHIQ